MIGLHILIAVSLALAIVSFFRLLIALEDEQDDFSIFVFGLATFCASVVFLACIIP